MSNFQDYRSIITATVLREPPDYSVTAVGGISYRETATTLRAYIDIIDLVQYQGTFEDAVREGLQTAGNDAFFLQKSQGEVYFLLDQTEAPTNIHELLYSAGDEIQTVAVELTTAKQVDDGAEITTIPKKDVVASLANGFQNGRIQVSDDLELDETLAAALPAVSIKAVDEANALVLAVALVSWMADRGNYDASERGGEDYDWANAGL